MAKHKKAIVGKQYAAFKKTLKKLKTAVKQGSFLAATRAEKKAAVLVSEMRSHCKIAKDYVKESAGSRGHKAVKKCKALVKKAEKQHHKASNAIDKINWHKR